MSGIRIALLGDIMLDRYVVGTTDRISPEAPVPVIRVSEDRVVLGGCGNVANCLREFGVSAQVFSVVGDDDAGRQVTALLEQRGIDWGGLIAGDRPTTTKTRVMAAGQQVVRVDRESTAVLEAAVTSRLCDALEEQLDTLSAVIVSDYMKGVISSDLLQRVIGTCRVRGIPVLCDPKGTDFQKYAGATLITPNRLEAERVSGTSLESEAEVARVAEELRESLSLEAAVITLGSRGMAVATGERFLRIPTLAREVFDVSGAGDTAIAALAVSICMGKPIPEAAQFANAAAGVVVGKLGTATASFEEIRALQARTHAAVEGKVVSRAELRGLVARWRSEGLSVAFTNGCFDVLHNGHVKCLEEAARQADRLIVGLNSDESVRRLKGAGRPVNCEEDRGEVLAALRCVAAVCVFAEDTPYNLIRDLLPDVLVKGGDYSPETVVGADLVIANGGRVEIVALLPGRSTTSILSGVGSRPD